MIKNSLKLEELAMFIGSIAFFLYLGNSIVLFLILLFLPDLGMIGYIINTKVGAVTYNVLHHKGIAVLFLLMGFYLNINILIITGIIIFAHSSLDRFLGYGLKYRDSFQNTHLGKIGR